MLQQQNLKLINLQEIIAKVDLQIYQMIIKNKASKFLNIHIKKIKRRKEFKCLSKIIQQNTLDKTVMETRVQKMRKAYAKKHLIYNKKTSFKIKIK